MKASIAVVFLSVPALFAAAPQSAVVVVPVADVWSRPLAVGEKPTDDLRETQVLIAEKVLIHESSGSWARIEAVEQPEFTHHNRWEGYPGWISANSLGYQGRGIPPGISVGPVDVMKSATKMIGAPYLWGGLSKSGIDCSGLAHLAYRKHEFRIPRDAHEQWMTARRIKRAELKPADLIFSAKADNPKKITHVALYAGKGMIIEAPQEGMAVRKISFKEKYGKPLEEVESEDRVGDRVLYFGSFLHGGPPTTSEGMTLK